MTFNGNRLRIGRVFQGWTQRELGERVAVSHSAIAFFEKGLKSPKREVQDALSVVLEVEHDFFFLPDIEEEFREEEANFRRRIAATDRQRKQILAHGSLFGTLARYLQREVTIPTFHVPEIIPASVADVDRVADETRLYFGLPLDVPIGSVSRILDRAGVLVLTVDLETANRIDAFSRYGSTAEATSIVVINTEKESPSRTLMDQAHELGHGVMHRSRRGLPLDQREDEANRFAGAFLMPRAAFTRDMMGVKPKEWAYLFEMKRHWGASIKAILYRAYELGLMDAADYRTRMGYYSFRKWNDGEPEEPARDQPGLFSAMLAKYCEDYGKSIADISKDLGWTVDLFGKVTGVWMNEMAPSGVLSLADYRERTAASAAENTMPNVT